MSLKNNIQDKLSNFNSSQNLLDASINLFSTLGYKSSRTINFKDLNTAKDFIFVSDFNNDKLLFNEWKDVKFLFELRVDELNTEEKTITTEVVDNTAIESYWFMAIELDGNNYTKNQLSTITREINKQRPIPVFILFKYADKLTLSIIDRRLNKKDSDKDVLEKVILIKDINYNKPHRAHIDILSDIAFENLNVANFVELHKNWIKALSVTELNKKFYTELSNWFFWMIDTCQLSKDNDQQHNVMFGIRLVTRLIFNWFIREKGLVSNNIFEKKTYLDLLKPEYKEQGDLYYKVILQNLFFGCLSKPMDRREFRKEERYQGKNSSYGVNDLFRYAKYVNNPKEVVDLFKDIPFLNGGLFECLDDKDSSNLIDCFTDNDKKNFLKIPDEIFFMKTEKYVDISAYFDGNKSYKKTTVKGLFEILNSYKFTIDETTPVEEEIALDPELLGRVFENLLAAHNPETKTTARKSTGSYYTPREIVDYMCEQSLMNYLKTKVEPLNIEDIDNKLKELFSYSETHPFTEQETEELIKAVNEVKILDPACGSGAFPMGLLHKLVHVLSKLDPDNAKWKAEQLRPITDPIIRQELEEKFEKNNLNYSRKLYLIQNCIFGVDIQPMATQISRLRFFISLIIDETYNKNDKDNKGILPLPNLETKFIAANTLLDLPFNINDINNEEIKKIKEQLKSIRERYFRANTRVTKQKCIDLDKNLRAQLKAYCPTLELGVLLEKWSPYDKDSSSSWFNSTFMFDIDKFDIVIGNPPYVKIQNIDKEEAKILKSKYVTASGKFDLYVLFIEQAFNLINATGIIYYIHPHRFLTADYGKAIKKFLYEFKGLKRAILFGVEQIFETATTYTGIFGYSLSNMYLEYSQNENENLNNITFNQKNYSNYDNTFWNISNGNNENSSVLNKIYNAPIQLMTICEGIYQGIVTLGDDIYILEKIEEQGKYSKCYSKVINDTIIIENDVLKPTLKGENIKRYKNCQSNLVVFYPHKQDCTGKTIPIERQEMLSVYPKAYEYISRFENYLRDKKVKYKTNPTYWYSLHRARQQYIFEQDKLITPQLQNLPNFTFDSNNWFPDAGGYSLILKNSNRDDYLFLLGILNSELFMYFIRNTSNPYNNNYYYFKTQYIEPFNIPNCTKEQKLRIVNLVKCIIDNIANKKESRNQENEIDIIVCKLYELTYEEVLTVDKDFNLTEEEYNNYKME